MARLVCEMGDEEQPQSTTLSIISLVLFPVLRDVFLRKQGLLLHSAAVKCPNSVCCRELWWEDYHLFVAGSSWSQVRFG
jgi:hypothetical protein